MSADRLKFSFSFKKTTSFKYSPKQPISGYFLDLRLVLRVDFLVFLVDFLRFTAIFLVPPYEDFTQTLMRFLDAIYFLSLS